MSPMTEPAAAAAPVMPAYHADQRVTLARVVRSEWTKLRSLPSAAWSLLTAVTLVTGGGVVAAVLQAAHPPHGHAAVAAFDPTSVSITGVGLAELATGVLGVLLITGEFATGQMRITFAAVPRRLPVLYGKAAVLALATLATCVPAAIAAFLVSQSILSSHHLGIPLSHPGTARALLGSALYLTAISLLGLGIGALLRHTAGGIAALFGVLFGLQLIVDFLPGSWPADVGKYLPANAGVDVTVVGPDPGSLGPWTGFGLLCLYTAAVLGLAAWRLRRRDA
jgi:ABC-2 type transport system permease protein